MSFSIRRLTTTILLAVVVLHLSGCVTGKSLVTGRKRAYGYTWQQEIELGKEADVEIVGQFGLYDDEELATYVENLGQRLLAESHARRPEAPAEVQQTVFTFRVLDSPVINAFALPGGYTYVTRGLLAHVENEAQLAVIIGHEIGHVVGRHASIRAATQTFGQALLIGGALGGQAIFGGDTGASILQGGGTIAQLAFLSYGRDAERESDKLGVEYAAITGYSSDEGAGFFHTLSRLSEASDSRVPSFLSTHPDPGERDTQIHRMAAEWSLTYPGGRVMRDALLAQIDGIVVGENPRSGFTEDRVFYHPDLAFRFPVPPGYSVSNQASKVILFAEDEASAMVVSIEEGVGTAREAAEKFGAQDGMTVVQSGIGSAYGLPAQFVVADVDDSSDPALRLRAHYVEYNGRVYSILGLASREAYSERQAGFIRTMQGFAPLRDALKLNVQPARLRVRTTASGGVFRSLIPSSGAGGFSARELAILNQVELGEAIPAGTALKFVEGS